MLFLLSPAKTLDFDTPLPRAVAARATEPHFADRAEALIAALRERSPAQVAALMDLSDKLAQLNAARYAAWQRQPAPAQARPAVLAFAGDVYAGLQAGSLKTADLAWAQQHLVILSGLYGALRPLDRVQPHRLEMGTALPTSGARDLYAYWGETLAAYLHERLAGQARPVIVNLASIEYARAALQQAPRARVVDCVFEEVRDGRPRIISFFAKRARGLMARFAVQRRARSVQALTAFDAEGYAYERAASSAERLVFRREQPG